MDRPGDGREDLDQSSRDVVGDRRVEIGQRPQPGLAGAAADPGDHLAFLDGGVAADEPSDDELDQFVAAAMPLAQNAVLGGDVRHGPVTDAVAVGDLLGGDAGHVVGEDPSSQPLRQLRGVRSAGVGSLAVEDPVQPVQWDLMAGADGVDQDVGLVVGDHRCLVDGDQVSSDRDCARTCERHSRRLRPATVCFIESSHECGASSGNRCLCGVGRLRDRRCPGSRRTGGRSVGRLHRVADDTVVPRNLCRVDVEPDGDRSPTAVPRPRLPTSPVAPRTTRPTSAGRRTVPASPSTLARPASSPTRSSRRHLAITRHRPRSASTATTSRSRCQATPSSR